MPDMRSRFLPVSFSRLVDGLCEEFADEAEHAGFREMVGEMQRIIADEAYSLQQRLTQLYDPFDRDSELLRAPPPPRPGRNRPKNLKGEKRAAWDRYDAYQDQRRRQLDELRRCVEYLFDKANFDEVPVEGVRKLLDDTRRYGPGVKVNLDSYEVCRVFGRGRVMLHKSRRMFRRFGRMVRYDTPSFSRLATMVKQPGDLHVQIYLYRNIDGDEFAPLLPGSKIRVSWMDRLMMLAAGGGSIAMVLRLIKTVDSYWQRATDSSVQALSWWPMTAIAGAVLLVASKALMSYKRAKDKYIRVITKSMFDSSLDNNAGALSYLIRLMTKEENQEGLLAYGIGLTRLGGRCTRTELDAAVESWCRERFDAKGTNFQVGDAVETMSRLGMLEDEGRTLTLRPLDQVAERLGQMRRDLTTTRYHLDAVEVHHRRAAAIEAGEYWICPNTGADGEIRR